MKPSVQFNINKIKSSVVELGAKCKLKKQIFKDCQRKASHGEALKPGEFYEAFEKLKERTFCSRYHNLAYAFARGKPYKKTENRTMKNRKPDAYTIIDILFADFFVGEAPPKEALEKLRSRVKDEVEKWLDEPATFLLWDEYLEQIKPVEEAWKSEDQKVRDQAFAKGTELHEKVFKKLRQAIALRAKLKLSKAAVKVKLDPVLKATS